MDPISTCALVAFIVVHLAALLVAWVTRLATDSRLELLVQLSFFVAMACVGAAACCSCQLELGFSVPSGITLVAMVLLAVVDFRPTQEMVGRLQLS